MATANNSTFWLDSELQRLVERLKLCSGVHSFGLLMAFNDFRTAFGDHISELCQDGNPPPVAAGELVTSVARCRALWRFAIVTGLSHVGDSRVPQAACGVVAQLFQAVEDVFWHCTESNASNDKHNESILNECAQVVNIFFISEDVPEKSDLLAAEGDHSDSGSDDEDAPAQLLSELLTDYSEEVLFAGISLVAAITQCILLANSLIAAPDNRFVTTALQQAVKTAEEQLYLRNIVPQVVDLLTKRSTAICRASALPSRVGEQPDATKNGAKEEVEEEEAVHAPSRHSALSGFLYLPETDAENDLEDTGILLVHPPMGSAGSSRPPSTSRPSSVASAGPRRAVIASYGERSAQVVALGLQVASWVYHVGSTASTASVDGHADPTQRSPNRLFLSSARVQHLNEALLGLLRHCIGLQSAVTKSQSGGRSGSSSTTALTFTAKLVIPILCVLRRAVQLPGSGSNAWIHTLSEQSLLPALNRYCMILLMQLRGSSGYEATSNTQLRSRRHQTRLLVHTCQHICTFLEELLVLTPSDKKGEESLTLLRKVLNVSVSAAAADLVGEPNRMSPREPPLVQRSSGLPPTHQSQALHFIPAVLSLRGPLDGLSSEYAGLTEPPNAAIASRFILQASECIWGQVVGPLLKAATPHLRDNAEHSALLSHLREAWGDAMVSSGARLFLRPDVDGGEDLVPVELRTTLFDRILMNHLEVFSAPEVMQAQKESDDAVIPSLPSEGVATLHVFFISKIIDSFCEGTERMILFHKRTHGEGWSSAEALCSCLDFFRTQWVEWLRHAVLDPQAARLLQEGAVLLQSVAPHLSELSLQAEGVDQSEYVLPSVLMHTLMFCEEELGGTAADDDNAQLSTSRRALAESVLALSLVVSGPCLRFISDILNEDVELLHATSSATASDGAPSGVPSAPTPELSLSSTLGQTVLVGRLSSALHRHERPRSSRTSSASARVQSAHRRNPLEGTCSDTDEVRDIVALATPLANALLQMAQIIVLSHQQWLLLARGLLGVLQAHAHDPPLVVVALYALHNLTIASSTAAVTILQDGLCERYEQNPELLRHISEMRCRVPGGSSSSPDVSLAQPPVAANPLASQNIFWSVLAQLVVTACEELSAASERSELIEAVCLLAERVLLFARAGRLRGAVVFVESLVPVVAAICEPLAAATEATHNASPVLATPPPRAVTALLLCLQDEQARSILQVPPQTARGSIAAPSVWEFIVRQVLQPLSGAVPASSTESFPPAYQQWIYAGCQARKYLQEANE